MLQQRHPYIELGPTYYEERRKDAVKKQSIRKLQSLDMEVSVNPVT